MRTKEKMGVSQKKTRGTPETEEDSLERVKSRRVRALQQYVDINNLRANSWILQRLKQPHNSSIVQEKSTSVSICAFAQRLCVLFWEGALFMRKN